MPIYEFYCSDCNTLFNFFSPTVDTERRPACPRCGKPEIERRPARFVTLSRSATSETEEDDPLARVDESRLAAAMAGLEGELGGLDEDADPRHFAGILRKVSRASGLEPGPKMEEMLARLESGADLDSLEEEMELPEGDEAFEEFFRLRKRAALARSSRPRIDEELYFF
jgi:putative FmdB family regulatory protein